MNAHSMQACVVSRVICEKRLCRRGSNTALTGRALWRTSPDTAAKRFPRDGPRRAARRSTEVQSTGLRPTAVSWSQIPSHAQCSQRLPAVLPAVRICAESANRLAEIAARLRRAHLC
eukprot:1103357_1